MLKIRFRPRSLGVIIYLFLIIALGILCYGFLQIIGKSLDPGNFFYSYLNNNIIADLVGSGFIAIVVAIFTFSRKNRFFLPIVNDDREVMNWERLERSFTADSSCKTSMEWGWQLGEIGESISEIVYKNEIREAITLAAQFKGARRTASNNYWRTGFVFADSSGRQNICIHIDNHNCLVAYLHDSLVLKVIVPFDIENKFVKISCQLSDSNIPGCFRVFCQIDNATYELGNFQPSSFPLIMKLRAWSDHHKNHLVYIRDISISKMHG